MLSQKDTSVHTHILVRSFVLSLTHTNTFTFYGMILLVSFIYFMTVCCFGNHIALDAIYVIGQRSASFRLFFSLSPALLQCPIMKCVGKCLPFFFRITRAKEKCCFAVESKRRVVILRRFVSGEWKLKCGSHFWPRRNTF